jgi:hypothetical protein
MANTLLKNMPPDIEAFLIKEYKASKKCFFLNDPLGLQLHAARFAEALLRLFQHLIGESITPFGTDIPSKEKQTILNKTQSHPTIDEHVRQKATSLSKLLLDFRNNRDVAHLGGFEANTTDSTFVFSILNWLFSELIRVYGGYTVEESQKLINKIVAKNCPLIVNINGDDFISKDNLTAQEEVLVLLTFKPDGLDFSYLYRKTKDKNKSRFKTTLSLMEREKLIVDIGGKYYIMPNGSSSIIEKINILL